eukprot:CAMPEP_0176153234 /NCGR_PEP_ID=MMETSP0120_2-20121206/78271_1 /TAXON_ID=160619 /ORGANISM="Kryptoperidinium foliaceum, Strain CCMP 1326" /LENGTH=44 /DNA_ID= /DNA_START= /DNA_END= /DNA_ORIENTATION=
MASRAMSAWNSSDMRAPVAIQRRSRMPASSARRMPTAQDTGEVL